MKTDSLFYRLFQRLPSLLLELAGLDISAEGYRFQSVEVKQTAFRLDGVLLPPASDRGRPCIFTEAQFQPDGDFYPRFFSEIVLYLRQHGGEHPWCAVVIYPSRAVERPAPLAFQPLLELAQVRRVYLEDFVGRTGGALGLIALIVCPQEQAAEQARQAAAQTAPPLPPEEWLDFIETILVYKLPQLSREEIKQMIGIQDIDLKQTRFYQDVFAEGEQEGLQKGWQKGQQAGELLILKRQLERKFGPLDAALQENLSLADADTLLWWSERILDARTPEEVFVPPPGKPM